MYKHVMTKGLALRNKYTANYEKIRKMVPYCKFSSTTLWNLQDKALRLTRNEN